MQTSTIEKPAILTEYSIDGLMPIIGVSFVIGFACGLGFLLATVCKLQESSRWSFEISSEAPMQHWGLLGEADISAPD